MILKFRSFCRFVYNLIAIDDSMKDIEEIIKL